MAKYCRKCGHKKEECICKKSKLNYPMFATIVITTLVVVGLVYFIISLLIVKPNKKVSVQQNNNQKEEVNESTKEEEKTKQEDEFDDWTQMINCTYLPKYNSNNYINYYLKNNKVVRIERLIDGTGATTKEKNKKVEELKEDYLDVKLVDGDIKTIITEKDKLWRESCGDCTANDVYRIAENNFYEYGMTCSTKDNN